MSSTNKTAFLELSQYVSGDKPTYSVDYNSDMYKIDAGAKAISDKATANENSIGDITTLTTTIKSDLVSAVNEVNASASKVGDLTTLNTTAKNTLVAAINEVYAEAIKVGDLTDLDTTAKNNVVSAINEVKSNIDNFNLTTYNVIPEANISVNTGTLSIKDITVAKNSDGSLAKIYGSVGGYVNGAGTYTITISNTGLSPTSGFTIKNAGMRRTHILDNNVNVYIPSGIDISIDTNGDIEISLTVSASVIDYVIYLWPCLYWITDFGDTPSPEL